MDSQRRNRMAQSWVFRVGGGRGQDGVRLSGGDVGIDIGECRVLWQRHGSLVVWGYVYVNNAYW